MDVVPPDLRAKPLAEEDGFTETLYPILVNVGVVALPAGVLAGLIANWIGDVAKSRARKRDAVIGLEAEGRIETVRLDDEDVERIAAKIVALLGEGGR